MLTFYAAECMAFPVMGSYQGGLTFADAVKAFNELPEGNPNGGKGIGFTLNDGSDYIGDFPLVVDGQVQTETINAVDHFRQMPAIQEVIADAKKAFPDKEAASELAETAQSPASPVNREAPAVTRSEEERTEQVTGSAGRPPEQTERKSSTVTRKESVLEALRKHQKDVQARKDIPEKAPTTQRKKGEPAL